MIKKGRYRCIFGGKQSIKIYFLLNYNNVKITFSSIGPKVETMIFFSYY
jgi:hypothetical protein